MSHHDAAFTQKILALDALTCSGAGLLMLVGQGPLGSLTGLPDNLLAVAGAALLPVAALFFFMSRMRHLPTALLWVAVIGNAGWVAASLAVLLLVPANALGVGFVAAQAAVVLALTVLEARGLSPRAHPVAA